MDVVLELFDTFLFDPLYAAILPANAATFAGNTTYTGVGQPHTVVPPVAWQYEPATKYLAFRPRDAAYQSALPRDDWRRQLLTLYLITWLFGLVVYYLFATLSYIFIFDKSITNHPKYLKNQIRLEMRQTNASLPIMALFTAPIFLAEVRGWTKLYDSLDDVPTWYNYMQFPFFLIFTDFFVYWIHRGLHHPLVYKHLHKPHHKWIMPTPFASHAFHPLDGFAQSIPYHVYPFLFPLQKLASVALFILVNIWTVMIHDGEYYADNPIINGAACHTMHHLYFNFNYGQYTTLWDRLGGSYRKPSDELFQKELRLCKDTLVKEAKETEKYIREVEGHDDRNYEPDVEPKKVR
ncbi:C-5 sterol desaturas-like protein [Massariosphaeria phaeospora]|uniref:C-5 sterol desaturas-like protein n=1 Tax=Massariosphaeria phaeospora TaxID=100035 RepID=A0A7C8M8G5_9PLEO|nr:C-5 sterol desaturas-like protein [Massariosphaeria phaeospora]